MNYETYSSQWPEKAPYIKNMDDVKVGDYLVDTHYLEMNEQRTYFYRVVKLTCKSVTIEKDFFDDGTNIPKPVRLTWEPQDPRFSPDFGLWAGSFKNKSRRMSFVRFIKAADLDITDEGLSPTSG